jgi:hypothetical protein
MEKEIIPSEKEELNKEIVVKPLEKEIIHKELDLIQDIIKRMAANSFEVKKWLIGILTAIVVFKHEELLGGNANLILLLLVPILCFWYLDAFFLSTEKKYREMYKWVITYRSQSDKYLYDLNTMEREFPIDNITNLSENSILNVMFTNMTLCPFYVVPIVFVIVYWYVQYIGIGHGGCCVK